MILKGDLRDMKIMIEDFWTFKESRTLKPQNFQDKPTFADVVIQKNYVGISNGNK